MNTKKYISNALLDLLKTKPFDKISVKDIVEHAEISRSTFYNHFSDKYEIIIWYCDENANAILQQINTQHWYTVFLSFCKFAEQNKSFFKNIYLKDRFSTFYSNFNQVMYGYLKNYFLSTQNQTELTPVQHLEISFIVKGTQEIFHEWITKDLPFSYTEFSEIGYNLIPVEIRQYL